MVPSWMFSVSSDIKQMLEQWHTTCCRTFVEWGFELPVYCDIERSVTLVEHSAKIENKSYLFIQPNPLLTLTKAYLWCVWFEYFGVFEPGFYSKTRHPHPCWIKPECFIEIGLYFEVSDDQRREYFGLKAFIATIQSSCICLMLWDPRLQTHNTEDNWVYFTLTFSINVSL
jgi:hypothetical protein